MVSPGTILPCIKNGSWTSRPALPLHWRSKDAPPETRKVLVEDAVGLASLLVGIQSCPNSLNMSLEHAAFVDGLPMPKNSIAEVAYQSSSPGGWYTCTFNPLKNQKTSLPVESSLNPIRSPIWFLDAVRLMEVLTQDLRPPEQWPGHRMAHCGCFNLEMVQNWIAIACHLIQWPLVESPFLFATNHILACFWHDHHCLVSKPCFVSTRKPTHLVRNPHVWLPVPHNNQ